jgi:hypothetical protein
VSASNPSTIDTAGMTELLLEPAVAPPPPRPRMRHWPLRWQRHDGRTSLRWSAESLTRHYRVHERPDGRGELRVQANPGRELLPELGGIYPSTDAAVDAAVALHEVEG